MLPCQGLMLEQIGVGDKLLDWFGSYLSNRSQRVVVGGQMSNSKLLSASVPQGSILGPLLFLIYINDITANIKSNIHQFADDTQLLEAVSNALVSIPKINRDLDGLNTPAKKCHVTFNPNKTYFMRISLKKTKVAYPPIYLNGTQIEEATEHTNLGLNFNNKMTWESHIN